MYESICYYLNTYRIHTEKKQLITRTIVIPVKVNSQFPLYILLFCMLEHKIFHRLLEILLPQFHVCIYVTSTHKIAIKTCF